MVSYRLIRLMTAILCAGVVSSIGEPLSAQSEQIARFEDGAGRVRFGLVKNGMVSGLRGGWEEILRGAVETDGTTVPLEKVRLLPPVSPSKIVCFGWTYPTHAREVGGEANRREPLVFLKPPSSLIGDRDTIRYPVGLSDRVEFEGELAIIIGKKARDVVPEEAGKHIFGYSCFNDVTARDLTARDPEYTRGKGFDTFGPLGPWIVTGVDGRDLRIITRLNGRVMQDSRTSAMTYSIPFLISYISRVMTLYPGDVIATGTPGGSAPMRPGDTVEVEVENVGVLVSLVR